MNDKTVDAFTQRRREISSYFSKFMSFVGGSCSIGHKVVDFKINTTRGYIKGRLAHTDTGRCGLRWHFVDEPPNESELTLVTVDLPLFKTVPYAPESDRYVLNLQPDLTADEVEDELTKLFITEDLAKV